MRFAPHLLSFFVGALSLGQEVLWVRLYGFARAGTPTAFSFVLVAYLLGIAAGAAVGRRITLRRHDLWSACGLVLLLSGAIDLAAPAALAALAQQGMPAAGGLLIGLAAAAKAIIFPIAHHLGTDASPGRIGRSLSRVYLANILGSTLGPLLFGFVLVDRLGTEACFLAIAATTFLVALLCLTLGRARLVVPLAAVAAMVLVWNALITRGQLLQRAAANPAPLRQIVETRQGIVALYAGGSAGDIVFGGNAYDGRTNLDPVVNSNGIDRILVLAALQRRPARVLMIGLSIGSWLKLVTAFPGLEHVDVVEINPGYLAAMAAYPRQAGALDDPRVALHIDDGRRWLRARPDLRYDLVIMNTTWHWRAYTSNLLSVEFLSRLRAHLAPGGLLAYNATGSPDALRTAAAVFPHAYLYGNFVMAGGEDFRARLDSDDSRRRLRELRLDGAPLFPPGSDAMIERYTRAPFVPLDAVAAGVPRPLEIVTDANLITEYRYGRPP